MSVKNITQIAMGSCSENLATKWQLAAAWPLRHHTEIYSVRAAVCFSVG